MPFWFSGGLRTSKQEVTLASLPKREIGPYVCFRASLWRGPHAPAEPCEISSNLRGVPWGQEVSKEISRL